MKYAKLIQRSLKDFLFMFMCAVAIALAMWGSVYMSGHMPAPAKPVVVQPILQQMISGMRAPDIVSILRGRGFSIETDASAAKIICQRDGISVEIHGLHDVAMVVVSGPQEDEGILSGRLIEVAADVAAVYYDGADRNANRTWVVNHTDRQSEHDDGVALTETRIQQGLSVLLIRPSRSLSVQQ